MSQGRAAVVGQEAQEWVDAHDVTECPEAATPIPINVAAQGLEGLEAVATGVLRDDTVLNSYVVRMSPVDPSAGVFGNSLIDQGYGAFVLV